MIWWTNLDTSECSSAYLKNNIKKLIQATILKLKIKNKKPNLSKYVIDDLKQVLQVTTFIGF